MIHQRSYGFALVFRPHHFRPEIYINRLGTTTQIFKAMDYLMLMSEKYPHFRKRQKFAASKFFPHPKEVTASMYFEEKLEKIVIISFASKLTVFLNQSVSKPPMSLH